VDRGPKERKERSFIYLIFFIPIGIMSHRCVSGTVLNLSDVIGSLTMGGNNGSVEDERQAQSVEWLQETYEPVSRTRREKKGRVRGIWGGLCEYDEEAAVVGVEMQG